MTKEEIVKGIRVCAKKLRRQPQPARTARDVWRYKDVPAKGWAACDRALQAAGWRRASAQIQSGGGDGR